jgi:hypothetical protein
VFVYLADEDENGDAVGEESMEEELGIGLVLDSRVLADSVKEDEKTDGSFDVDDGVGVGDKGGVENSSGKLKVELELRPCLELSLELRVLVEGVEEDNEDDDAFGVKDVFGVNVAEKDFRVDPELEL